MPTITSPPPSPPCPSHRLSVAPMMDWTDRHCRYFLRLISKDVRLYTEMVTTGAVLHGKRERLLGHCPEERPLALQLGGDDPAALAESARIGEDYGYTEINLNVGCPSPRVQKGRFGACLMAHPDVVADCVAAMRRAVSIPVTVKHRIGIDHDDRYEDMARFVSIVAEAGCSTFIVHARKAWLHGLSPQENRCVPPLRHADVHRLKRAFPHLHIVINGGISTLDEALNQLDRVDGVMMGRAIYHNPYLLADADRRIFRREGRPPPSRAAIVHAMYAYARDRIREGDTVVRVVRHMHGLFHGVRGARRWKRHLAEHAWKPNADPRILLEALALVNEAGAGREACPPSAAIPDGP